MNQSDHPSDDNSSDFDDSSSSSEDSSSTDSDWNCSDNDIIVFEKYYTNKKDGKNKR